MWLSLLSQPPGRWDYEVHPAVPGVYALYFGDGAIKPLWKSSVFVQALYGTGASASPAPSAYQGHRGLGKDSGKGAGAAVAESSSSLKSAVRTSISSADLNQQQGGCWEPVHTEEPGARGCRHRSHASCTLSSSVGGDPRALCPGLRKSSSSQLCSVPDASTEMISKVMPT